MAHNLTVALIYSGFQGSQGTTDHTPLVLSGRLVNVLKSKF